MYKTAVYTLVNGGIHPISGVSPSAFLVSGNFTHHTYAG